MFAAASPEITERYLTAVYLSQRAQSVELSMWIFVFADRAMYAFTAASILCLHCTEKSTHMGYNFFPTSL